MGLNQKGKQTELYDSKLDMMQKRKKKVIGTEESGQNMYQNVPYAEQPKRSLP